MHQRLSHYCTLTGHPGSIYTVVQGFEPWQIFTAGGDGWVVAWDLRNPDPGRLVAKVEDQLFTMVIDPQTNALVVGGMGGGIYWIDPLSSKLLHRQHAHPKGMYSLVYQEGKIFSGGGDGRLTRWNAQTYRPEETIFLSDKSIRTLIFDKQSGHIVAGVSDGRILWLDAEKMLATRMIDEAHLPSVFTLIGLENGTLWSGGRDAHIRIWDSARNAYCTQDIPAHLLTVNHLTKNPSGSRIASASRDKSIRIWDAKDGQLLQSLTTIRNHGHHKSVNRLVWTPYENYLVSVSDDKTLIIWRESEMLS